jgi:4-methylaminobutanoate oxidase (formaldehyde-forming)
VVIVGGGIIGCSVAYHLVKLGWRDVVLLERGRLTCGTSWHAAGLVMQLRATATMTALCRYTAQLLEDLKAESGQDTGFRRNGSLPIARTPERLTEIKRLVALGRYFGVEAHVLDAREVKERYPALDGRRVVGGAFIPGDGQTNPVDTTSAYARVARKGGARIFEGATVTGFRTRNGAIAGVATDRGEIACEVAVNCAGAWARQVGALAGVAVPLYAAEHMYVTTEPSSAATSGLPVLRDTDGTVYVKEDAGKFVVGCFEPEAKPLSMRSLPVPFEFGELPQDWEHFEGPMSRAIEIIPALEALGIRHFMNGPESFTPDNRFVLGEAPALKSFYVAAGFNSQGVLSSGGVGRALAAWIAEGEPDMDLSEIDIARFHPFQVNRRYLRTRTRETVGLLYAMHWPYRQMESARGVRRSALHERLAQRGACFGEVAGWERANWYAAPGAAPAYAYAYGRQNWFEHAAAEHRAAREAVALFDQSSFAKYLLQGRDAESVLQRLCANDVAVPPGRIVYTAMLNRRGGIEADLTVTRLAEDAFFIVSIAASQTRDFERIRRHIPADARAALTDVTSAYAVLNVQGPRSRDLLSKFDNIDNPYNTMKELDVGDARAWAFRISYVGELGWELYVPSEFAVNAYDALVAAGGEFGLRHAGYHALDSLRLEKGSRSWGHDLSPADTPLEAGLEFAVAFGKQADFIGREALLRQRETGVKRRLLSFTLDDPRRLLFHDEPIYGDGRVVGRITSAAFGHTLGRAVGLGYVEEPQHVKTYEIDIAGERVPASVRK